MTELPGSGELAEVHLVGLPLDEQRIAAEHFDELLREFALIGDRVDSAVPKRLLELRAVLLRDFGSFTAGARDEMDAAAARGDATIDLRYVVPPAAATAAADLGRLLDEADDFCRGGQHLLTLATPARALRFRRWYLGEFARQIAGEPPQPWPGPLEQPGAAG